MQYPDTVFPTVRQLGRSWDLGDGDVPRLLVGAPDHRAVTAETQAHARTHRRAVVTGRRSPCSGRAARLASLSLRRSPAAPRLCWVAQLLAHTCSEKEEKRKKKEKMFLCLQFVLLLLTFLWYSALIALVFCAEFSRKTINGRRWWMWTIPLPLGISAS